VTHAHLKSKVDDYFEKSPFGINLLKKDDHSLKR
jgi:hypothetical protein